MQMLVTCTLHPFLSAPHSAALSVPKVEHEYLVAEVVSLLIAEASFQFQGQLSRQGSSVESTTIVPLHHHTAECAGVGGRSLHQPTEHSKVL